MALPLETQSGKLKLNKMWSFEFFPIAHGHITNRRRARALGVDDDEWKALTFGRNKKKLGKYCWKMSLIISCLNPPHCWASAYLMQYTRAWAAAVEVMMMHAHSFFCFEHFTGAIHSPLAQSRVSQPTNESRLVDAERDSIAITLLNYHYYCSATRDSQLEFECQNSPSAVFFLCHNLPTPNSRAFLTFSSWAPQICAPSTHRYRDEWASAECNATQSHSHPEKKSRVWSIKILFMFHVLCKMS